MLVKDPATKPHIPIIAIMIFFEINHILFNPLVWFQNVQVSIKAGKANPSAKNIFLNI